MRPTAGRPLSVAFYLPQYHVIPENEQWWGRGFTDWDNVERALPLFPGHAQPDLPGELGRYDLLDPAVRTRQAELALNYGIDAFCYHHYWFSGRRLLSQPVDQVLLSGRPDISFCLSWANESWTREWSGSGEVLIEQTYDEQDDEAHGYWLAAAFRDPRYLRVDDRAVMLVYGASALPDPRRTTGLWRQIARAEGAGDLLLCAVRSSRREHGDPRLKGFDAAVDFQPDWRRIRPPLHRSVPSKAARALGLRVDPSPRFTLFDYEAIVARELARPRPSHPEFPCVMPAWDNTPRRQRNAIVVQGSTPGLYGRWTREHAQRDPRLLFVNAWNEWAEGCHLEPGLRWGRQYLEAHAAAVC